MNSTTNPTFILENANYIFGRFFDGWENVYLGEERERTGTLYVKGHRIGTLNQFRVDKEYSDADIKCDIYNAILHYIKENGVEEIQNPSEPLSWESDVWDILCNTDSDYGYDLETMWNDEDCAEMYV